jgi:hypothetical protein
MTECGCRFDARGWLVQCEEAVQLWDTLYRAAYREDEYGGRADDVAACAAAHHDYERHIGQVYRRELERAILGVP